MYSHWDASGLRVQHEFLQSVINIRMLRQTSQVKRGAMVHGLGLAHLPFTRLLLVLLLVADPLQVLLQWG